MQQNFSIDSLLKRHKSLLSQSHHSISRMFRDEGSSPTSSAEKDTNRTDLTTSLLLAHFLQPSLPANPTQPTVSSRNTLYFLLSNS